MPLFVNASCIYGRMHLLLEHMPVSYGMILPFYSHKIDKIIRQYIFFSENTLESHIFCYTDR